MRRARCPYCDSLNTAEFIAGNQEQGITASGYICDDCDSSWDGPSDARAIKKERLRGKNLDDQTVTPCVNN